MSRGQDRTAFSIVDGARYSLEQVCNVVMVTVGLFTRTVFTTVSSLGQRLAASCK